jgi:hypothetical protein
VASPEGDAASTEGSQLGVVADNLIKIGHAFDPSAER